jgi:AcrR family transcriptional regulator
MTKLSKNSTDPRVARTRKMLRHALFTLLEHKPFDTITVLEITKQAELNPATFYLHYDDKYDLLNSIVAEIDAIITQLPQIAFAKADSIQDAAQLDIAILGHIEQYKSFYRLMLGKYGVAAVREALYKQLLTLVRGVIDQIPTSIEFPQISKELAVHLYAGAYMGVIEWWLASNEPMTAEQLAQAVWRFEHVPTYGQLIALMRDRRGA